MSYIKVGQLVIVRPSSRVRMERFKTHLERAGIVLETHNTPDTALVSFSEQDRIHILQEDLAVFVEDLLRGREK